MAGLKKHDPKREAAAAAYQKQFASIDLDALDEIDDEPTKVGPAPKPPDEAEPASRPAAKPASRPAPGQDAKLELDLGSDRQPPTREPSATRRPNLEPIGDEVHPPEHRRAPTQPPEVFEAMLEQGALEPPTREYERRPELTSPPPKPSPRHSPAPVRRGLLSGDRLTNMLGCAAIGLLLAVFPAKKLAQSYETREVEPRLADLETAVRHTLAVDAGLVESPEAIAADIHAGREQVRKRFFMIWLLAGLPIGLGLSFAPRPGD